MLQGYIFWPPFPLLPKLKNREENLREDFTKKERKKGGKEGKKEKRGQKKRRENKIGERKKKTWIKVLNYYLKFVSLCENIYHEKKENNRNTFNYKKQAKFSSVSYKNREGFQNFWRGEGDFAGWPEYISL